MATRMAHWATAAFVASALALFGSDALAQQPVDGVKLKPPNRHSDQDGCGVQPGEKLLGSPIDPAPLGRILYVDARATGNNDGRCWLHAFNDLQDALDEARIDPAVTEIWVAQGVYHPDRATGDRAQAFELVEGVHIFGGFAGTETAKHQRNKDPITNQTILSGDLADDDATTGSRTDNSFHVVRGAGLTRQTILDGFSISGGWADGAGDLGQGGGMYLDSANPRIRNCLFYDNAAVQGGAVFALAANPKIRRCGFLQNLARDGGDIYATAGAAPLIEFSTFIGSQALQNGGSILTETADPLITHSRILGTSAASGAAMFAVAGSRPVLINCVVTACTASADGGAMLLLDTSELTLVNGTIAYNTATGSGGGVYLVDPASILSVENTILWGNRDGTSATTEEAQLRLDPTTDIVVRYSCIEGWSGIIGGTGNINRDPSFVSPDGTITADLTLRPDSPAIDAGDSDAFEKAITIYRASAAALFVDIDELERLVDDPATPDSGASLNGLLPIDIGASEFQLPVAPGESTGNPG